MSYYDIWGRPNKGRDSKQFFEKAFRRKGLPAWDEKWHQLSPEARLAFVEQVKGPAEPSSYGSQPSVPRCSVIAARKSRGVSTLFTSA